MALVIPVETWRVDKYGVDRSLQLDSGPKTDWTCSGSLEGALDEEACETGVSAIW